MLTTDQLIAVIGIVVAALVAMAVLAYLLRRSLLIQHGDGSLVINTVMQFDNTTAFLMNLIITNASPQRTITVRDYKLEIPWNDEYLKPLPDPREVNAGEIYHFMDTCLDYPRDLVINHRRLSEGKLPNGETISGMFLVQGLAKIPFSFFGDNLIPVTVVITDTTNRVYRSKRIFVHPSPPLPGVAMPDPPTPITPRPTRNT